MIDDYLIEDISAFHIVTFPYRVCENRGISFSFHADGQEIAERRKPRIRTERSESRRKETDEEVLG